MYSPHIPQPSVGTPLLLAFPSIHSDNTARTHTSPSDTRSLPSGCQEFLDYTEILPSDCACLPRCEQRMSTSETVRGLTHLKEKYAHEIPKQAMIA
jgi:hypothetical protein